MSNLTRWDPFGEMESMRTLADRFFNPFWESARSGLYSTGWDLALDVAETDDEYLVKTSLPGITPEDIDVTCDSNVLTIKGEIRKEEDIDDQRYHLRERRFGTFSRSITLPTSVKADKIEARYDGGILTLHLPKSEENRPKRIRIQSGEPKKMIEGKIAASSKN
jgi:HSP20 family protein